MTWRDLLFAAPFLCLAGFLLWRSFGRGRSGCGGCQGGCASACSGDAARRDVVTLRRTRG